MVAHVAVGFAKIVNWDLGESWEMILTVEVLLSCGDDGGGDCVCVCVSTEGSFETFFFYIDSRR